MKLTTYDAEVMVQIPMTVTVEVNEALVTESVDLDWLIKIEADKVINKHLTSLEADHGIQLLDINETHDIDLIGY